MKRFKDSSLEKLKDYKKYSDFYDTSSLEVRTAIVTSILMTCLSLILVKYNGLHNFIEITTPIIKDISLALIIFLGFMVVDIAILTSTISKKAITIFKQKNLLQKLEKILYSFYFLALLTGIEILFGLCIYMISQINIPPNIVAYMLLTMSTTYTCTFIIFYAISLVGTCLNLFFIKSHAENIENTRNENTTDID